MHCAKNGTCARIHVSLVVMGDLEELYLRHVRGAMAVAWLAVGDADMAADLVQETFVRCAARRSAIRDERAFGAYWQQAVVRAAANERRHAGPVGRALHRLTSYSRGQQVEDPADAVTLRLTAQGALMRLPVRQRAVVVARFYLDLSVTETADLLGTNEGTVKSLTSRGLAALRVTLGELKEPQ